MDGDSSVIVDENSLLRNYILVKSYLIGGSGERWLPTSAVDEESIPLMVSFFSSIFWLDLAG